MSKKPTARINSNGSINKAIQTAKNTCNNSPVLHISAGNAKLGSIMNISLPPVVSCHNCGGCAKYCYAIRSYLKSPQCMRAWGDNYKLFLTDPDRYFSEISDEVKLQRFFRWHVSGDIVNAEYFAGMIRVAVANPKIEFLAFTKAYHIVNAAIAAGAVIPDNLHVIFSAAPGVDMPNPYRLPECHIAFADPNLNTYTGGAEYVHECGGNCAKCCINGCGCFFLKSGDVVLINQH